MNLNTIIDRYTQLSTTLSENLLFGDWGPTWGQGLGAAFWLFMAAFSWWFVGWRSHAVDRDGEPLALRLSALALRLLAVGLCVLLAVDILQVVPAKDVIDTFQKIWGAQITDVGGQALTVSGIVTVIAVAVLTIWGSNLLFKVTVNALDTRGVDVSGTIGVLLNLGRYVVIVLGLAVGLSTAGIDLTALLTVGAVFAVTIGFALQNIAQNFVSGVILLVEGAIKPGDVLEVEGRVVRVVRMGIRSTVVQTMDDEDLILPNSVLAQGMVKNLTMRTDLQRVRASISVAYESDLDRVKDILDKAAVSVQAPGMTVEPLVLLQEFGDSGINFDVLVWLNDPWAAPKVRSALRFAIWRAFRDQGIVIPFPQVDVHMDPEMWPGQPVQAGAAKAAAKAAAKR